MWIVISRAAAVRWIAGFTLGCALVALAGGHLAGWAAYQPGRSSAARSFSLLAWNVSSDAFVRDPAAFRSVLAYADADILLFDEVSPAATEAQLRGALNSRRSADKSWRVSIGQSGGRQRGVIATRFTLETVPELSGPVPYPAAERQRIHRLMVAADADRPNYSMDGGIPVNGAVVTTAGRRLLVVILDLQCCGDEPASWEEDRRRVEAREIRLRIGQALKRIRVDGIVVAGDMNLVSTPLPMVILAGPYARPHAGLLAADVRQLDGTETWTWDGRGTPFPSRPMDFVLYSPHTLRLSRGYILDSADIERKDLERLGLRAETSSGLSSHRPVIAHFDWY